MWTTCANTGAVGQVTHDGSAVLHATIASQQARVYSCRETPSYRVGDGPPRLNQQSQWSPGLRWIDTVVDAPQKVSRTPLRDPEPLSAR
jgi:hypothetical protein